MARKPTPTKRPRTGLAGAPKDDFQKLKSYFHFEIDKAGYSKIIKEYVKSNFNAQEAKYILANPEIKFVTFSHVAASCYWASMGGTFPENYPADKTLLPDFFSKLIENGKILVDGKDDAPEVKRLSPLELMARKVNQTVMLDIDELEDKWANGEQATLDMYEAFNRHDLKGAAVEQVKRYLLSILEEYNDAVNKTCEQAVEAYSHLKLSVLKFRVKTLTSMLDDLDRVKDATKAKRTVRKPKAKPIEKQVANVKYLKEDTELKLVSLNPAQLVGANRAVMLNAKTRTVIEYVTDATTGFIISGTSIKNFDPEASRSKKLRKPEEFIPFIKKTVKQFDKAFNSLTTKEAKPNGRINDDTLILKVG